VTPRGVREGGSARLLLNTRTLGGGARSSPADHAKRRTGTRCDGVVTSTGAAVVGQPWRRTRDARDASATASGSARPAPPEAGALRRSTLAAARASHRRELIATLRTAGLPRALRHCTRHTPAQTPVRPV
jgi:hypothetical protein